MSDTHREARIKRLRIRCWRRGTREMDLLLGRYFDRYGASMSAGELDSFEALIAQADPTLLAWLTGISEPTENHAAVVIAIRRHYLAAR